jgi:hypothetical protein
MYISYGKYQDTVCKHAFIQMDKVLVKETNTADDKSIFICFF